MAKRNVCPNSFTFPFLLNSCSKIPAFHEGKKAHCFAMKIGFGANSYVGTALTEMYSGGGAIGSARKVFDEFTERCCVDNDCGVYILSGDLECAGGMFDLAPECDIVLWNSMAALYVAAGDMVSARHVFDQMPVKAVMVWNKVLSGYASNRDFTSVERLLDEMPKRNVFTRNGLIEGMLAIGSSLKY